MPTLIFILSLALSGAAHARYEDAIEGELPMLGEANLLPYTLIGLGLWLFWVWADGWRARAWPVALALVSLLVAHRWGGDGLGLLLMYGGLAGMVCGTLRRD